MYHIINETKVCSAKPWDPSIPAARVLNSLLPDLLASSFTPQHISCWRPILKSLWLQLPYCTIVVTYMLTCIHANIPTKLQYLVGATVDINYRIWIDKKRLQSSMVLLSNINSTFLAVWHVCLLRLAISACVFCKKTYYFPLYFLAPYPENARQMVCTRRTATATTNTRNKYVHLWRRTYIHTCWSYIHMPSNFTNSASLAWRLRRRISTLSTVMFTCGWGWPTRWPIRLILGFWWTEDHKNGRFPALDADETAVQNLTLLALSSAEKSITIQTNK